MSWHQATTLEKLDDGPVVFKQNRRQIALFLVEDDVYAVDNRCPHEGYPLIEGTVDEQCQLTCNWHNWKFRLSDGRCVLGGDHVRRYDVKIEEGQVLVDLSEPSHEVVCDDVMDGLKTAFRKRDYGRLCREITRLHFNGLDPVDALREAIGWSHDRFEYGSTHAYAAAADWAVMADSYADDWERRLVCLAEAVDHMAFDALRHPEYAYAEPGESFSGKAFTGAIEGKQLERAEGLVRRGLADGLHFSEMERAFTEAALAHYNDFGHSLIYVQKTGELIACLGHETEAWLLPALARHLVYTSREDLIPEFSGYAGALADVTSVTGPVSEPPGDPLDTDGLQSGGVQAALDWTREALADHGVETVYESLLQANARGQVFYDVGFQDAFDRPVNDSVGWLSFTHALTFSGAVAAQCRKLPHLWPAGLLQMACFVGRNQRFQDRELDPSTWWVDDSGAFLAGIDERLLDHGQRDPIFSAHLVKTSVAIRRELETASEETSRWLLAALNRFLNSPLKQKHVRRLARQAIDLVARDFDTSVS